MKHIKIYSVKDINEKKIVKSLRMVGENSGIGFEGCRYDL